MLSVVESVDWILHVLGGHQVVPKRFLFGFSELSLLSPSLLKFQPVAYELLKTFFFLLLLLTYLTSPQEKESEIKNFRTEGHIKHI